MTFKKIFLFKYYYNVIHLFLELMKNLYSNQLTENEK